MFIALWDCAWSAGPSKKVVGQGQLNPLPEDEPMAASEEGRALGGEITHSGSSKHEALSG